MGNASMGRNISQYNQVNIGGASDADPHRLVLMLLEGVIGKLAMVKGLMMRNDVAKKGELIGQAIAIIGGLKTSLNKEEGGDIAENLNNIYEYMEHCLAQANIHNDVAVVDEVVTLLHEIKIAWESIPDDIRKTSSQKLSMAL